MKETGIVKDVSGEFCHVVVTLKSACGENCASCGGGCKLQNQICLVKNTKNAKAGDRVEIEIDSITVLKSAFLVYILPLLVFIITYLALSDLSEPLAAVISLGAMICIFALLFIRDKNKKSEYISHISQILEK